MTSFLKSAAYVLRHIDPESGFGLLYAESRNDCVFLNPLAVTLWKAPVREVDPQRDGRAFDEVFGIPGGAEYLGAVTRDMAERGVLVPRDTGGLVSSHPELTSPNDDGVLPPLEQVYFYATRECNARCYHCYQPTFTVENGPRGPGPDQLDGRAFLELLKSALPLGVRAVKITGGEPLLRADLRPIIEGLRHLGLSLSMETNAFLLDEAMAGFLAETGVEVSVSLDGGSAEVHDSLRGLPGSFEKATSALRMLADRGCDPTAIVAISRRNLGEVENVLAAARSSGCTKVKFNPVNSLGVARRLQRTNVLLDVGELMALYARRAELEERHDVFLFLEGPPSFATVYEIVSGHSAVCPFTRILGVLADGSISFCGVGNSCPELIFGQVTEAGFDIGLFWRTAGPLVDSRRVVAGRLGGVCRRCVLAPYCRGSCRALAYGETGSLAGPHPFCQTAYDRGCFPAHYLTGGESVARQGSDGERVRVRSC